MPSTSQAKHLPESLKIANAPIALISDPLNETLIDHHICRSFTVPGIARTVEVKIASERKEWEQAFALLAETYKARGYEAADSNALRFTPFHALPDTVTFVAKYQGNVMATLSLVLDNYVLGLPMECIYGEEIEGLRRCNRRFGEVTSLADKGLSLREFIPVFVSLMRILAQYTVKHKADTWVISVNPRHRNFYRKVMGFVPLGPWREYPSVQNHPAEAYLLDVDLLRAKEAMHEQILGDPLSPEILDAAPMPAGLVREFSRQSSHGDSLVIKNILEVVDRKTSMLRWR
jgi:hypothetical protein